MKRLVAKKLRPVAALLVLLAYVWIAVFGIHQTAHASGMDQHMHSDCPYVVGQHSICAMDLFDHLQAWQAFSTLIIPVFEILIFTVLLFTSAWLWYLSPPLLGFLYTKQTCSRISVSLYQQLFSRGILNPKAP